MLWQILLIILLIINEVIIISVANFIKEPITIIDGFIKLEKVVNPGLAFGINNSNKSNFLITLIVMCIVFHFIKEQKSRLDKNTQIAIALVLAGGIGNLIDRLIFGGVLDYISIIDFPIFNFADILVVVGWVLLCIAVFNFARMDSAEEMLLKEQIKQEFKKNIEEQKKNKKKKK